jgi:hypothetical protein
MVVVRDKMQVSMESRANELVSPGYLISAIAIAKSGDLQR